MLASILHCDSEAARFSAALAGMEMRSDKIGELKQRRAGQKKTRFEPPEWLDLMGCDFNRSGSQLSSRPCASRKMIKDAMRSVFKDESEGPLWLSLCLQFSYFSVVQLWTSLTCYCRWWQARQTEGRAWPLVQNALVFLAATAALSEMRVVCARMTSCHWAGWGEVACQIRLPWQCNNNEVQSLMLSNAILVMLPTDAAFGKRHLKITSLNHLQYFLFSFHRRSWDVIVTPSFPVLLKQINLSLCRVSTVYV